MEVVRLFGTEVSIIAVAPMNLTVELPNELEATSELLSDALVRHLEINGKTILGLEFGDSRTAWSASINQAVASGEKQSFRSAARIFVGKIRESVEFDALLFPSVFIQQAKRASGKLGTRSWDGARQQIKVIGSPKGYRCAGPLIDASSVLIAIFDPDGNEIHTKQSGVELLNVFEAGPHPKLNTVTCDLSQVDPSIKAARAAVARGLSPFLPIVPRAQTLTEPTNSEDAP